MEPQNNSPDQQPLTTISPVTDTQNNPAPIVSSAPQTQPLAAQSRKEPSQLTEKAEKLKKFSIQVMIGGLIGAAVLAVVAVLAGSFNETFGKALFTLFLVVFHALACLAFVEQTGKKEKSSFKFFENAVFFIIVLSFFTSIFGVWGIIDGSIVAKLYGTYFVLLFACLHGQMLVETRGKKSSIDTIVTVNYVMMGLVILLILPLVWFRPGDFPDFYFRLLAASGIIDGTLTILAVIFHRLYVQKHPEVQSNIFSQTTTVEQKRHIHPLVWILGILIIGQIVVSVLFAILGAFYR